MDGLTPVCSDNRVLDRTQVEAFQTQHPSIRLLSFDEVKTLGGDNSAEPIPPQRQDVFFVSCTHLVRQGHQKECH
jgi:hypothetical protein